MTKYEKKIDKYTAKAIKLTVKRTRRYCKTVWKVVRKTFKKDELWRDLARDLAVVVIAALLIFGGSILSPVAADEAAPPDEGGAGTEVTPETPPPAEEFSSNKETPPSEESAETEVSEENPTIIETGDASSGVEVENQINTNTVETENGTTTEDLIENNFPGDNATSTATTTDEGLGDENATSSNEASSTPETSSDEETVEGESNGNGGGGGLDLTIEGESNATTTNNATSTAQTGENEASENPGDTIIDTGNAFAYADIVNVVNTNIVDSEGFFLLMNTFSQLFGDIDFRNVGFEPLGNTCPEDFCSVYNSLQVSNLNYATTTNNVSVTAATGQNVTENNDGSTIIRTGRAAAGANVVNVVNTNIVESNYLLVTINQFNGWIGDLVLPAKSFFQQLFSPFFGETLSVANTNTADIQNNISTEAETGDNEADENEEGSTIETGNAVSSANVVNTVNTNLTGGTSVMILVRVHGNWNGNVFSTPPGITWEQTPSGLAIYGLDADSVGSSGLAKTITVENENYGTVANNVSVLALTGQNKASGNGGSAAIQTGDARAGANVVNVVNTNIVGHNWLLALVNIFGDWNGNVAFGRPDLWVGSSVEAANPAFEQSLAHYTITVTNRGDTDATNVRLLSQFDNVFMAVSDAGGGTVEGETINWDLGTLAPGATSNVSFSTQVTNNLEPGTTAVENTFTASSYEPDNDPADNTDSVTFAVFKPPIIYTSGGGSLVAGSGGTLKLVVAKSYIGPSNVIAGSTIPFKVVLKNESDFSAYNVTVKDLLVDSAGLVVRENQWSLGEVFAREEIMIDYNLAVEANAPAGKYVNHAFAFGQNSGKVQVESNTATSTFAVIAAQPEPLATVKKLVSPPTAEADTIPRFFEYVPPAPARSPTLLASLLNLVSGFWAAIGALIALALILLSRRLERSEKR